MNATSTENFHDVIAIDFELQTFPNQDVQDKFIVSATNRDDIFCFVFEGPHIEDACRKAGLFTGWEKDQKIRELENELEYWKKEAADCLRLRDEAQKEAYKLKKENEKYEEKIKKLEHADMLDKEAADYWSKEHDTLSERFAKLQEENKKLKDKVEHVEPFRALERTIREKHELKKELALEKAANEAQHKFFRQYTGKGTEIEFNYAIDDVKEVSYVIVDKEEYNKNFEKWLNAPASTSRADILDQAKKCVCGQREQDYGTPESNFQLIADLWNHYLGITDYVLELEERFIELNNKGIKVDIDIPKPKIIFPEDVAMMMALLKIARIRNGGGSGDSFVDLAGYAACGGEIWHGQKVKDQN